MLAGVHHLRQWLRHLILALVLVQVGPGFCGLVAHFVALERHHASRLINWRFLSILLQIDELDE